MILRTYEVALVVDIDTTERFFVVDVVGRDRRGRDEERAAVSLDEAARIPKLFEVMLSARL